MTYDQTDPAHPAPLDPEIVEGDSDSDVEVIKTGNI